jgi:hypothetical protein
VRGRPGPSLRADEVTAEKLVNWLGRQQHLSSEGRKSYRGTLRGFFVWM